MSSVNPIGGYLEIDLRPGKMLHQDATYLNSGRHSFEYIVRAVKATKIYIAKFTCDVMLEPLQRLGISHEFYSLNEQLELRSDIQLKDDEYLVYVNYFGVRSEYVSELAEKYKDNLIIDNSQAFYNEPLLQCHSFYSPRKFFGLPDGGMAYTPAVFPSDLSSDKSSHTRMSHLLKRIEIGAEEAYSDYKKNDNALSGQPLLRMSVLTKKMLGNIDYDKVKQTRMRNFTFLHEYLSATNSLKFEVMDIKAPLCYPYMIDEPALRQKLINEKIFVPMYWPNVRSWCKSEELEYQLSERILALPVDQRYGQLEMERIIEIVHG